MSHPLFSISKIAVVLDIHACVYIAASSILAVFFALTLSLSLSLTSTVILSTPIILLNFIQWYCIDVYWPKLTPYAQIQHQLHYPRSFEYNRQFGNRSQRLSIFFHPWWIESAVSTFIQ